MEIQSVDLGRQNNLKIRYQFIQNKHINNFVLQLQWFSSRLQIQQIEYFINNFIVKDGSVKKLRDLISEYSNDINNQLNLNNASIINKFGLFDDTDDEISLTEMHRRIKEANGKDISKYQGINAFKTLFGNYIMLPELIFRSALIYKMNKLQKQLKKYSFKFGIYGNVVSLSFSMKKSDRLKITKKLMDYITSEQFLYFMYELSDKILYISELSTYERQIFKSLLYYSFHNLQLTVFCDNLLQKEQNKIINIIRDSFQNLTQYKQGNIPYVSDYFEINRPKYINTDDLKLIHIIKYFYDDPEQSIKSQDSSRTSDSEYSQLIRQKKPLDSDYYGGPVNNTTSALEQYIRSLLIVLFENLLEIRCVLNNGGLYIGRDEHLSRTRYNKFIDKLELLMNSKPKLITQISESYLFSEHKLALIKFIDKFDKNYMGLLFIQVQKTVSKNFNI